MGYRKMEPFNADIMPDNVHAALGTCHSVTRLGDQLVGSQVEVKMFEASGWHLDEGQGGSQPKVRFGVNKELTIVRRFEFDHTSMTMSVIVRQGPPGSPLQIFCKGAPEKVHERCLAQTLPPNANAVASAAAIEGCYVLGLAQRDLGNLNDEEVAELARVDVEQSLTAIGLIMFRNELKHDTAGAITSLREGAVRPVMITGDNAQCAYYISRACGMLGDSTRVLLADMGKGDDAVTWRQMGNITPENDFVATVRTQMADYLAVRGSQVNAGDSPFGALSTKEVLSLFPDMDPDRLEERTDIPRLGWPLGSLQAPQGVELAATGRALQHLLSEGSMEKLLLHTRIFARTSPNDKVAVLQLHISKGLICTSEFLL